MKKRIALLLAVVLTALLCACGGEVGGAKKVIGPSQMYEERDIFRAMDIVADYFKKEFDGCELLRLSYDEDYSMKQSGEWAEQYKSEQAIVLTSSFYVRPNGGNGTLEPNETYDNWKWILTRSGPDDWKLQTWGYG